MDETQNKYYPDIEEFEDSGDLKKITRLPQMQSRAPKISWGKVYQAWPIDKQLRYAESLANSMNHAADVLQKDRDRIVKLAKAQEVQLKENVQRYTEQGELMHKELAAVDAEKQKLYTEIVELKTQLKLQARRIKALEADKA